MTKRGCFCWCSLVRSKALVSFRSLCVCESECPCPVPRRLPRPRAGHARPLRASAARSSSPGSGTARVGTVLIGVTGHGSVSEASPWDQRERLFSFTIRYPGLCDLLLYNALPSVWRCTPVSHRTSWKRQFRLLYDHTVMPKCIAVFKQPADVLFKLSGFF